MHKRPSFVRLGLLILALTTLAYTYTLTWPAAPAAASDQPYQTYSPLSGPQFSTATALRLQVADIDLLGMTSFPTGYTYGETEVGGLSGLVYNRSNGYYTAISDDRSQRNPARGYNLQINLEDGSLDEGDVTFSSLISLENENEEDFPVDSIDAEGLALTNDVRFFISSEGNTDAEPPLAPFIREFSFVGSQTSELPLPDKYLAQADGAQGTRNNLGFESLAISPNQRYLYAALENALLQDGPIATLENGSPARILQYDLATSTAIHEYLYMVDPIPQAPDPADGPADNGLVDLQPLDDNGTFLAMERSYAVGVGNTIRLYLVSTQGAQDILGIDSLLDEANAAALNTPVHKELLIDLAELGIQPDNLEAMAFGPLLADGRQSLVLVSDNNFNETQSTQFIVLALSFDALGVVNPKAQTAPTIDSDPASAELPEGTIAGTASDPAIWVHPTDAARSLVFAALQNGGLAIFGLDGNTLATIPPETYGTARYDNLSILYNFDLNGTMVDLVIATDGANDTLVIFAFEPTARTIENVTSESVPAAVFGGADGLQGAYGLATYTDPADGAFYAFVSQNGGNQVAQLALTEDGNGAVSAEIVRTITLPATDTETAGTETAGTETAGMAQGIAVDQTLGYLYVIGTDGTHVLKYKASATAGTDPAPVRIIQTAETGAAVMGLSIYYGANGDGYLLTAVPSRSSYALFERSGDNRYVGSFAIGEVVTDSSMIDQANGSLGLDVVNIAIGSQYPTGLLVVQDNVDSSAAGEPGQATNFKLVPWGNVAGGFAQPLLVDPEGYQPR